MAKPADPKKLLLDRQILAGAIWEQKNLVQLVLLAGLDPEPYEENVRRLTQRLRDKQREINDYGLD